MNRNLMTAMVIAGTVVNILLNEAFLCFALFPRRGD